MKTTDGEGESGGAGKVFAEMTTKGIERHLLEGSMHLKLMACAAPSCAPLLMTAETAVFVNRLIHCGHGLKSFGRNDFPFWPQCNILRPQHIFWLKISKVF